MHELAICEDLIAQLVALADKHEADRVVRVTLQIGPLSGIEAPQLVQAFEVSSPGTVAENAELAIETPPVVVWCEACAVETEVEPDNLRCGSCGNWQVELRSGGEMILKNLQMIKN